MLVLGNSGAGKTTLPSTLAGLLTQSNGKVSYNEGDIYKLSSSMRDDFWGKNIGLIFQEPHLTPVLSVKSILQTP